MGMLTSRRAASVHIYLSSFCSQGGRGIMKSCMCVFEYFLSPLRTCWTNEGGRVPGSICVLWENMRESKKICHDAIQYVWKQMNISIVFTFGFWMDHPKMWKKQRTNKNGLKSSTFLHTYVLGKIYTHTHSFTTISSYSFFVPPLRLLQLLTPTFFLHTHISLLTHPSPQNNTCTQAHLPIHQADNYQLN